MNRCIAHFVIISRFITTATLVLAGGAMANTIDSKKIGAQAPAAGTQTVDACQGGAWKRGIEPGKNFANPSNTSADLRATMITGNNSARRPVRLRVGTSVPFIDGGEKQD